MKYLAIVLLLAGCATAQKTEPVSVVISEPCKTQVPAEPSYRYSPPYTDIFEAVRDLLGDRELSTAYQTELKAAIQSCK